MTPSSNEHALEELAEREKFIEWLSLEQVQLLLDKQAKNSINHAFRSLGFRIEGPGGFNDIQEDMFFLRTLRKEFPMHQAQIDIFKTELLKQSLTMTNHEKICGDRYMKIDKAQDTILLYLKIAMFGFVGACVSIIGYFFVNYVFISVQP